MMGLYQIKVSSFFFLEVHITLPISEIIPYSVAALEAIQRMEQVEIIVPGEMYRSYPYGLGQRLEFCYFLPHPLMPFSQKELTDDATPAMVHNHL